MLGRRDRFQSIVSPITISTEDNQYGGHYSYKGSGRPGFQILQEYRRRGQSRHSGGLWMVNPGILFDQHMQRSSWLTHGLRHSLRCRATPREDVFAPFFNYNLLIIVELQVPASQICGLVMLGRVVLQHGYIPAARIACIKYSIYRTEAADSTQEEGKKNCLLRKYPKIKITFIRGVTRAPILQPHHTRPALASPRTRTNCHIRNSVAMATGYSPYQL